jgi:threonyl-tRNA synthetase
MDKIVSQNYPILREEVSREEARRRIEAINEPFKLEILDGIKTEPITIYHIGDKWWDLCAGPHLENTGQIPKKAVSLMNIAGAYWRGDENRQMLQRIYATAWKSVEQLKAYKKMLEEAKKRDHRTLGKKIRPLLHSGGCRWWTCFLASQGICRPSPDRRFLEVCSHRQWI